MAAAAQQLADHQHRPALIEQLHGLRDRAELAVARHGGLPRPQPSASAVARRTGGAPGCLVQIQYRDRSRSSTDDSALVRPDRSNQAVDHRDRRTHERDRAGVVLHDHPPTPCRRRWRTLKTRQQQIWSSGDYGRIAWITVPLARELVEAVDRVRDPRCWTSPAVPATSPWRPARNLLRRTGIDYVPALVDVARTPRRGRGPRRRPSRSPTPRPCRSRTTRSTTSCPRSGSCSPRTTTGQRPSWSGCAGPAGGSAWPAGPRQASSAGC